MNIKQRLIWLCLLGAPELVEAQTYTATYTTLADPLAGATATTPVAVSGNNIVGFYEADGYLYDGFLYNGSTWTTLSDPGSGYYDSHVTGISGNSIVGWCYNSAGAQLGFLASSTFVMGSPNWVTPALGLKA